MAVPSLLLIPLIVVCLTSGCEFQNPFRPDIITNVRFGPDVFDSYKRHTSLRYTLLMRAKVTVWIANDRGEQVIALIQEMEQTKGSQSVGWLGLDSSGAFVPPGVYIGTVQADHDQASATVVVFHLEGRKQ